MHIRALLKSGPQILIQPSLGNGVHWSDCRADPIHLRGYAHGHNLASATAPQKPAPQVHISAYYYLSKLQLTFDGFE